MPTKPHGKRAPTDYMQSTDLYSSESEGEQEEKITKSKPILSQQSRNTGPQTTSAARPSQNNTGGGATTIGGSADDPGSLAPLPIPHRSKVGGPSSSSTSFLCCSSGGDVMDSPSISESIKHQHTMKECGGYFREKVNIGIARLTRDEATKALLKCTSHMMHLPKEKNYLRLLNATRGAYTWASVADVNKWIVVELGKRSHSHNWIVAMKSLLTVHRILLEGSLIALQTFAPSAKSFAPESLKVLMSKKLDPSTEGQLPLIRGLSRYNCTFMSAAVDLATLGMEQFLRTAKDPSNILDTVDLNNEGAAIARHCLLLLDVVASVPIRPEAMDNFVSVEAGRCLLSDSKRLFVIATRVLRRRLVTPAGSESMLIWLPFLENYNNVTVALNEFYRTLEGVGVHYGKELIPTLQPLPLAVLQKWRACTTEAQSSADGSSSKTASASEFCAWGDDGAEHMEQLSAVLAQSKGAQQQQQQQTKKGSSPTTSSPAQSTPTPTPTSAAAANGKNKYPTKESSDGRGGAKNTTTAITRQKTDETAQSFQTVAGNTNANTNTTTGTSPPPPHASLTMARGGGGETKATRPSSTSHKYNSLEEASDDGNESSELSALDDDEEEEGGDNEEEEEATPTNALLPTMGVEDPPQQRKEATKRRPGQHNTTTATTSRFKILRDQVLGRGAFGTVYKAWDEEDGRYVAAKEIIVDVGTKSHEQIAVELSNEFSTLTQLDHPNIVRMVSFTMATATCGHIFMEWMPAGSVHSILKATKGGLRENIVRRYTVQVLRGLQYLHARKILHRDIKPGNMLLSGDGCTVKLSDFGTARITSVVESMKTENVVGTVAYLAPECLQGTYSVFSDVWAIGCSVLEMTTGKLPWTELQFRDQISLIFHIGNSKPPHHHPKLPENVSPALLDFMMECFRFQYKERPEVTTLLQHPFIVEGDD